MSKDGSAYPHEAVVLEWLHQHKLQVRGLSSLPGDVSLRRYFRVDLDDGSAIVAVYPPQIRSSCQSFLTTTRLFSEAGVRVPEVLIADCEQGYMLIEDVGSKTLYDLKRADPSTQRRYFWLAVADIDRIHTIPRSEVERIGPAMNGAVFRRELEQTWKMLFEPLAIDNDPALARELDEALDAICGHLDNEPAVPCHRDFMARNLVPLESVPDLVVLDHQDLRLGPAHYDLASLLNDSLFPSADLEEEILVHTFGNRIDNRVPYHRAAAQRTLKATGTYLMFAQRGFDRHRKLVPATLVRSLRHLARLPEASRICPRLERTLQPLLASGQETA